jgi:hypothetical protein
MPSKTPQPDVHHHAERADPDAQLQEKRAADSMIAAGAGVGILGVVTAAIGGAVCPVCVVAAPALIGVGALRRWRNRRR